jgi:hypothetical protein
MLMGFCHLEENNSQLTFCDFYLVIHHFEFLFYFILIVFAGDGKLDEDGWVLCDGRVDSIGRCALNDPFNDD